MWAGKPQKLKPITTGAYYIWKMRAIYHRFDGLFDEKRG